MQNDPRDMDLLALNGKLDSSTAPDLENALNSLLETENIHLIINCENLDYIDSYGFEVLFKALENCKKLGGDIKLVCSDTEMRETFDSTGITKYFAIYDNNDDAIKSNL